MTTDDWRAISDGWVANLRRDLATRRGKLARSLGALTNRDTEFAKGHERMLRVYDAMLSAIDHNASPHQTGE